MSGIRHFVMIRSAYSPDLWSPPQNALRLRITKGVTAASLATQSTDDFRVVVLLDPDDPLVARREECWRAAVGADRLRVVYWKSDPAGFADWDTRRQRAQPVGDLAVKNKVAATAYRAVPWATLVGAREGDVLMTRLDDDDALAPDALERARTAAERCRGRRVALVHPIGFRTNSGRYDRVTHKSNAMHSLLTPDGDATSVYDYGHTLVRRKQEVVEPDQDPAWLWVRHGATISGWRKASRPINRHLRAMFRVDWHLIEEVLR